MVCCDRCETWFHPACIGMAMSVYHELVVAGDHTWFCHECTDEAHQQQDGDTQMSVAGAEAEKEPAPHPEESLTAGSTVCTCERAYKGELVLRCSCCQRAYHPDCVGLRQWEDWSDWRCNRCPRYSTRRKTVSTASDGHQSKSHSSGDRTRGTHAGGQQGSVVIETEAPADVTGQLVAQPCSVGQLVTMAFEETCSTGATEVRDWPGQIVAIEVGTGLLTVSFDDGCVETHVSPDDPDLNLQPQLEQHQPSRGSEGDIAANGTDAETATEAGGRSRGGSRPISLILGKGKGNDTKPRTASGSDDRPVEISRVRLRLISPLAERPPGSPVHKRPRLVMRPHTAALTSTSSAAAPTSTASKLRLVVGRPVTVVSPRRFRWTIGKRQPRQPLMLTVPARRFHRDQGGSGRPGRSRENHTVKSHTAMAPVSAEAPAVVALGKEEGAPVAHYCPVCLCDAEDPIMTPCSHWFCRDCLARAAKECGRRCPMCRRSLLGFARALLPEAGSRVGLGR